MGTMQIILQRFSVSSSKSFQDVVSRLEAAVGHPDMSLFRRDISSAKTYPELEKVVEKAVEPSGFMEFARFDLVKSCVRNVGRERQEVCGSWLATHSS
jgi:hypothetical protein